MKKNTPLATHRIVELFNDSNVSGVAYKNKSLKRSILSHLDQHGEFTITELSRELNTSVPKITSLVNELIEDRLIRDNGKFDSTGGRRASIYGLVADACYFIGVDVKRYYINIGLLDFKKHLVSLQLEALLLNRRLRYLDSKEPYGRCLRHP